MYRDLSRKTEQPLHLGLTEAGMGTKGVVWSAAALGILLQEGIGDTIRISLTPRPGGDRREEVYAACELLQSLGLRSFAPSVTACPGCGRTTSTTFQELAERIQDYIRDSMPQWKQQYEGVEEMTLAVMGCIVNGPGESKAANIGISLPGTGEEPSCPVYIDGKKSVTLHGNYDELSAAFRKLVDDYIQTRYAARTAAPVSSRIREGMSVSPRHLKTGITNLPKNFPSVRDPHILSSRLLKSSPAYTPIGCRLVWSPPRRVYAELFFPARGDSCIVDCVFFACSGKTSPRAGHSEPAQKSLDE